MSKTLSPEKKAVLRKKKHEEKVLTIVRKNVRRDILKNGGRF